MPPYFQTVTEAKNFPAVFVAVAVIVVAFASCILSCRNLLASSSLSSLSANTHPHASEPAPAYSVCSSRIGSTLSARRAESSAATSAMHARKPIAPSFESAAVAGDKSALPLAWESVCTIKWQDQNQIDRTAVFQAFEESLLYQLIEGDTVNIRFNPTKPSEYYLPGLLRSGLTRTWKLTVYALLFLVLGIGFLVFLFAH